MSLVRWTNKKTGITYVYESESYWDKEKKQPRNRRKLVGKVDDETGEIVPTRGRGKRKTGQDSAGQAEDGLKKQLDEKEQEIARLRLESQQLMEKHARLLESLQELLERHKDMQ